MRRASLLMLALLAATVPAVVGAAGHAPAPEDELRERLQALKPSDPQAYFELGEEVADRADDPGTLALARRLFVLAEHLDRARGGRRIAASSCLALAELAGRERDRRWLESLAGSIDAASSGPPWVRRAEQSATSQIGYNAATTLGLVRSGDGVRARQALADPATRNLLRSYERLLNASGLPGALRLLEREAERWPCPECHNQRIVRKAGGGREPQYRLCTNCGGHPGPALTNADLVAHLRFESQLLSGIQRSWAAQAAADRGAPLRDPNPDDIAPAFDVDPSLCVFRDGSWVDPTGGRPKAAPSDPAAVPSRTGAPPAPPTTSTDN